MDVVTAYLNGELKEDVYMSVSEGFTGFMEKLELGLPVGTKQVVSDAKHKQLAKK